MMSVKLFESDFEEISKGSNIDRINKRRIINGEDDGLMQVSPLKHPFADEIFKTMLKNTWVPQEVQMAKDIEMWESATSLTEKEREVYKRSLAFVSNLDGIQTNNLVSNICKHITSPEVTLAVVRQAYEEALHVHAYSTVVETLNLDPEEVYGLYRKDKDLFNKNKKVLAAVSKIADSSFKTGTLEGDQTFLEACVANIILEGIYFYSAFVIFYIFRRNNKMPGSAEMIQFINRDEDMHLQLFINITNKIAEEQPELWTEEFKKKMTQNIIDAVELEYSWGVACIGDGILGLNPSNLKEYLQFVGDMRLVSVGLPKVFNSTNPFPWIDDITQSSMIEVNFFEGTVKEYSVGSLEWD